MKAKRNNRQRVTKSKPNVAASRVHKMRVDNSTDVDMNHALLLEKFIGSTTRIDRRGHILLERLALNISWAARMMTHSRERKRYFKQLPHRIEQPKRKTLNERLRRTIETIEADFGLRPKNRPFDPFDFRR